MSTASTSKADVGAVGEVEYVVLRGNSKSWKRVWGRCVDKGIPYVRVKPRHGGASAIVDMDAAGHLTKFDITTDVRLRAVIGSPYFPSEPIQQPATGYYAGRRLAIDPHQLGIEVAEIVADGLPYMTRVNWSGSDYAESQSRHRDPDWPTLAQFWGDHVQTLSARRSIETRYLVRRSVKDVGQFEYEAWCKLARRPSVMCKITRGRGDIEISGVSESDMRAVAEPLFSLFVDMMGQRLSRVQLATSNAWAHRGRFHGVPDQHVESFASEIARHLAGTSRLEPSRPC